MFLIEDYAMFGSKYKIGKKNFYCDLQTFRYINFSFHPLKTITTGEGAVTTNKKL